MERRFITAVMFGLLSAASALADDAGTNKSKAWPYGPYDKLHLSPAVIIRGSIVQTTTVERSTIIIYRGTQSETFDRGVTNAIVPPKLELKLELRTK